MPYSTFYRLAESSAFADAIRAAEAEFERAAVQRIERAAGQGSWRADAFLLERRVDSWQQQSDLHVEAELEDVTPQERSTLRLMREEAKRRRSS